MNREVLLLLPNSLPCLPFWVPDTNSERIEKPSTGPKRLTGPIGIVFPEFPDQLGPAQSLLEPAHRSSTRYGR